MTVEQRLQLLIGQQAFQIAVLSAELEKTQAELTELKEAEPAKPAGDNPA